jgi:Fic family protein
MEMLQVNEIRINATTKALLDDIRLAAKKVNDIRPLSPGVVERVRRDILGERVYTSNAIEGNTLDLRETIEILKAGHVSAEPRRRREATEALNLGRAVEHINDLSRNDACNVTKFLDVHRILLANINDDWAGRFRDNQVMIRGAKYQPPDGSEVSDLMDHFLEQLAGVGEAPPTVLASWAHWSIARIHPFFDGNGRMARLWQDLLLFHYGLTCAIIRPEDRRDYLAALEKADEGDFNLLIQLVTVRAMSTLDKCLNAQQEEDARSQWAERLVGETAIQVAEARRLSYLRWVRMVEEVRYECERCAALVTRLSADVNIQLRPYEVIDESAWELIRSGSSVSKTWFFTLRFQQERRHITYFFFFGRHFWSTLDPPDERGEPTVCLLVSESLAGEQAERLAGGNVFFPTLREIIIRDDGLARKRYDLNSNQETLDNNITAVQIAQDFIQEVLLRRLPELSSR